MRMPPAPYAFASIPHVGPQTDGVPKAELAASLARGEGYLGATRNGWQEALGVHITSGKPEQLIVLPNPTYLPLVTALVTGGVVLGFCSRPTGCRRRWRWSRSACSSSRAGTRACRATTARCRWDSGSRCRRTRRRRARRRGWR